MRQRTCDPSTPIPKKGGPADTLQEPIQKMTTATPRQVDYLKQFILKKSGHDDQVALDNALTIIGDEMVKGRYGIKGSFETQLMDAKHYPYPVHASFDRTTGRITDLSIVPERSSGSSRVRIYIDYKREDGSILEVISKIETDRGTVPPSLKVLEGMPLLRAGCTD